MSDLVLPLVDFGNFIHGTPEVSRRAAKELVESFKAHGFVRLKNHGFSKEFVQEIWKWGRALFQMPEDQKKKIMHPAGPDPQRGWSRKGLETTSKLRKENAARAPKGKGELLDEKEHFDCGPPGDAEFPNKYPSEEDLPGYKEFVETYFMKAQEFCINIMRACEVGFGMESNTLVERCSPPASELRLLYYPAVSVDRLATGTIKRAWPHTDFGIITLLFQDSLGGLEAEDRRNPYTFAPVMPSDDNEMVVNTSDSFTRWTNSQITAGVHQVNVPRSLSDQSEGDIPARYSSVFFFKAHRQTSVGPIPHFVTEEYPAKFPEMTALEFHRQMTDILY